jgi:methionyl-tRNA formyltransferase
MRIIFCGTPEFAVPSLRRLAAHPEFSVEAVITQPDRPSGRGQHVTSPAVKEAALEAGLHVYQPESIKSESSQDFLKRIAPDAVVIIAYGQIVPARLLAIPRLGWINLHASLLPRYRGAAPIHWAIANGETHSGLTTMQIDAGMDTGTNSPAARNRNRPGRNFSGTIRPHEGNRSRTHRRFPFEIRSR